MRTHCCTEMQKHIYAHNPFIMYLPPFREYGILLIKSFAIKIINYCPWCNHKLPAPLRKKFYETLLKEYNIEVEPGFLEIYLEEIPTEFHSDEWWKKRNIP